MRFGEIPLGTAEGAILAHSLKREGLVFKKGRRLDAEDLAALAAAGVEQVTAARLGDDDVHEDEAAAEIAAAATDPALRIDAPFTGRVNVHAREAGLVVVDRERIDRLNAVDEAITIATLAAFAPVTPKQMVATIKIIPFAVSRALLERCLAIAQEGGPLVGVAPYRPLDVTLIQTRLPSVKESVLDKTVAITADRVAAAGGRMVSEARCPHEVAPLAERIRAAAGDLLLIAGASAITDRKDVLPAAIEAVGGTVEHFGMPVDPGNLLLLGRLGGRVVLGLPGCCRSPKLNGFDWVLQRIAAGLEVGGRDIMAMGVGGLLTEIPSRPQPREAARPTRPGRIAALVLAAGQSRRMGRQNKLLAPVDGKPLVAHMVDAVLGSRAGPVIVVTGHEEAAVRAALGGRRVIWAHNPDFAQGLSTSLKAGLDALPEDVEGVLVALGDMPRVKSAQIDRLIAAFNPVEGRAIMVPTVRGKRGNPVLFASRFVPALREVAGDVGGRHLLGEHAEEVVEIEMEDEGALLDIDTPAALDALTGAST
jgi:molybdenum cofactor cytidylyltransferase